MSSGVILVAPPWPRSGSANLFAAQAAAHARRGARVFQLLTPLGRQFARHKTAVWQDAVSSMKYSGVETVSYPRAGRRRGLAYLQWLLAGRDDSMAISARYGASGRMPGEIWAFLASARIDLIHANHAFSMPLAQRVAGMVQRSQGQRPRILLDTHDVQSDTIAALTKRNPYTDRLDLHADLLHTELALCSQADALVHLTQADCDFFAARLPDKIHALILPTLDPANEAELVRRRAASGPNTVDLVYVGTQNLANVETVRWLLTEVLPLADPAVADRIRIVGSIGGLLSRRGPPLYQRYARLFVGEVPSIFECYAHARAILAPAMAGTGSSIKLIEALCAGKPVLTTSLGLRGLPAGELGGADIEVQDTAADFAAALTRRSHASAPAFSAANAALYDRLFSSARYAAVLNEMV
jgi:glycosyltransferase involved in cell wall biosynthesis